MKENKLVMRWAGRKIQVLESETGLIWRTLNSRPEAQAWIEAAEAPKKK